jgi:hypothetical protein
MASIIPDSPTTGAVLPPKPRTVPAAYLLAAVGALVVGYALWTWGAWLLDGPKQITASRDTNSISWTVARVYEGLIAVAVVWLSVRIVRQCIHERKLVFDGVMVIAGFFTLFWDPMVNWMQPNFMYSSNWLNLNTWVAQAPFVVNPTAGLMPQPVFIMLIYPFGLLAFAMIINHGMGVVRRRFPRISNVGLVAFAYAYGWSIAFILEAPAFLTNLWGLPGAPAALSFFGDDQRFAWPEYLTTAIVFTTFASVRYFRNDKGQTIGERGLEGLSAGMRTIVSTLATIAMFAMSMWGLLLIQIPGGMNSSPYPDGYPAHQINGLCDIPGNPNWTEPTEYGPCPGSPGFRMPIAQTFEPSK